MPAESFYEVITKAINDFAARGYDSQERLDYWTLRIRDAAAASLIPEHVLEQHLRGTLQAVYQRLITRGGIMAQHRGLPRFTLGRIEPRLRAELDRRILASANLIKLNRSEAIETTLRRFQGWATSIPPGGGAVDKLPTKEQLRKSLASLPFESRRVAVDQGHKFVANLSEIIATDGGALAAIWRHHYVNNPRKVHVARAGKVFAVRDNWALRDGLMKIGANGYTDEIEKPATLIFCRCSYQYLHALRELPADMVTVKGRTELARVYQMIA